MLILYVQLPGLNFGYPSQPNGLQLSVWCPLKPTTKGLKVPFLVGLFQSSYWPFEVVRSSKDIERVNKGFCRCSVGLFPFLRLGGTLFGMGCRGHLPARHAFRRGATKGNQQGHRKPFVGRTPKRGTTLLGFWPLLGYGCGADPGRESVNTPGQTIPCFTYSWVTHGSRIVG